MPIYRNVAGQKLAVYAWDDTTSAGTDPAKTGDAANTTAEISLDGGVSAATNDANPTELEATDHPGVYVFDLTQAETNADMIVVTPVSVTANILLEPIQVFTIPRDFKLQYDGTGVTGDTLPATQAQVGNIATGAGGLSALISAFAKVGAEPETNTFADTQQGNLVYHIVEDDGGNTDFYYQATVGAGGKATAFKWRGYVQSNGDSTSVWYWDWVSTTYKQIDSLIGSNGTTPTDEVFDVPVGGTGTGADEGKVRLRFLSTTTTAIATDKLLCEFTQASQSAGYQNGQIWVNTNSSNTGTVLHVDGVVDHTAGSWANAVTISGLTTDPADLTDFHILNGSTITLTGTSDNFSLFGDNWILQLASRSVAGAYIQGAAVSGICTAATEVHFEGCDVATASVQLGHFDFCTFSGTVTHTLAGDYNYHNCKSMVAGPNGPTFAKTAGQAITAQWRDWAGSINLTGLEVGDTITIGGAELGTIDLGSPAGAVAVEIRGIYKALVNVGSAVVNLDGAINAADVALILEDTNELQTDDVPGLIAALNNLSQAEITGGAYALDTDANGRIRIVDGTGVGELDTASGLIAGIAGTITTLDALDTAQDSQHSTTQSAISALSDFDPTATPVEILSTGGSAGGKAADELVDDVWDEELTGATHNVTNSSGKRLRESSATLVLATGTAQAGAAGTITLEAGENSNDTFYDDTRIVIVGGAGVGQARVVHGYVGSTLVASIAPDWVTTPNNTSEYQIQSQSNVHVHELTATAMANVRTAVGLASANLDTQLAALPTQAEITGGAYALDTDANGRIRIVDGTGAGELDTNVGLIAGIAGTKNTFDDLNDASFATTWTTQLTESYAANGVAPTPAQAMFAMHQALMQFIISGTDYTARKLDNSTVAFVGTLDDASSPTSLVRV